MANTIATGAALIGLIFTFGSISGAHLNPAVTVADALGSGVRGSDVPSYMSAQILGGITGTVSAHIMFALSLYSFSQHPRHGASQLFSEFVATFGLLAVILGCSRIRSSTVPFGVASYVTAAYWFTASTSFANPAVTIARSLSNTFAGIRPADVPLFIVAQVVGAFTATFLFRWLLPCLPAEAKVVLPYGKPVD